MIEENKTPQNNQKNKYALISVAAVLVIAIIAVIVAGAGKGKKSETAEAQPAQQTEDTTVYTPTFMYFVSKNNDGYDAYMAVVEELKKEYEGKVTFSIVDIDEDPDAKANFPVDENNTPALFMTDTSNDLCAIEFSCGDKDKLKADIETSLDD